MAGLHPFDTTNRKSSAQPLFQLYLLYRAHGGNGFGLALSPPPPPPPSWRSPLLRVIRCALPLQLLLLRRGRPDLSAALVAAGA